MAARVPPATLIAKRKTTRKNIKRTRKHMAENGQKSHGRKRNTGDRQARTRKREAGIPTEKKKLILSKIKH